YYTPIGSRNRPGFDQQMTVLSRRILQFMALERVPQLVIAEIQGRSGSPLIEAVTAKRILEQPPLILRDRAAEIAGLGSRRGTDHRREAVLLDLVRSCRRLDRSAFIRSRGPRRLE